MSKCSICKCVIESDDAAMICVSSEGLPCLICDECERNLSVILDSDNREEIGASLDYIYSKFNGAHSSVVIEAVNEIISESGEIAKEIQAKKLGK